MALPPTMESLYASVTLKILRTPAKTIQFYIPDVDIMGKTYWRLSKSLEKGDIYNWWCEVLKVAP